MIQYFISVKDPASHYIDVRLEVDGVDTPELQLQLPSWRPGRYELGNFAKNIKRVDAFDAQRKPLPYAKDNKDLWRVHTAGATKVILEYSYYAAELNAGSCYADADQLYINPVHLCMYVPGRMQETHTIHLDVPDTYTIAGSQKIDGKTLTASHFDELADSPFIASATLQSDVYEAGGIRFWLHFNGECKPDFAKIKAQFKSFTETQLKFWGDFPVEEYHFLFQVLPYKFYHGVEHQRSTVIALGPGYALNSGKTYEDLLGVSSHELFHTWNIKYIRPQEMHPYDYTKENYARTGYVYEGFTTYYGDWILRASGVFSDEDYFATLEERLHKHFHNYGRFNLSVAHSSWETWLDGYVPGAPYRKTSIYDEGNLIALMLDILILKHSGNKRSLQDVCRALYTRFGKERKGYSEQDIIRLCEEMAGVSLTGFFNTLVYGTENFEPMLRECFDYVGLELKKTPSVYASDRYYGFKSVEHGHARKVTMVAPGSPSWDAGLGIGDEIMAVNGYALKNDLNEWLYYFHEQDVSLMVTSAGKLKTIMLKAASDGVTYFDTLHVKINNDAASQAREQYRTWLSVKC